MADEIEKKVRAKLMPKPDDKKPENRKAKEEKAEQTPAEETAGD